MNRDNQGRRRGSGGKLILTAPLSHGGTAPSQRTLDNRTQPPRATSQKPRDGRGIFMTRSLRQFLLNYLNPQPDNRPLNK